MDQPVWVRNDVVLAIHQRQLAEHGGAQGIRDEGLLDSAMARAPNLFTYSSEKPDIAALAAAYAFGITKNHPFMDGNKRTAFVVSRTFLLLNGKNINAKREEKYLTFLKLACGDISEEDLAMWIREHLVKML